MDAETIHKTLAESLKKYATEYSFTKFVLGVSGGIDSAVTLKLAVDTFGTENVTALIMPENGLTKSENTAHAKGLCEFLGVQFYHQPINSFMLPYSEVSWKQKEMAYMNTKARIRANLLYNYANSHTALVLGTSNKSELLLGYGTKHGDLAADILPLGDLYKTQVYELADYMELPKEIIEKPPSAELAEGQTDEAELGGSYKDLDIILEQRELGEEDLIAKGMNAIMVRNVFRRMKDNKHKLETPPIIQIT